MRSSATALVIILLTTVVVQTAIRIEILNTRAGHYLPRSDRNPDGTFPDGEWRRSLENTPRDQLRGIVQTFGLSQYLLAPLLLILGVAVSVKSRKPWTKIFAATGVFVAVIAVWLMLYREYYQSLGW